MVVILFTTPWVLLMSEVLVVAGWMLARACLNVMMLNLCLKAAIRPIRVGAETSSCLVVPEKSLSLVVVMTVLRCSLHTLFFSLSAN